MPTAIDRLELATTGNPAQRAMDYRLDDVVLHGGNGGGKLDIDGHILKADLELTIEGASTLTIVVEDPELQLLRSDLLTRATWGQGEVSSEADWVRKARAVDVVLDTYVFRLVEVAKKRTTLTLSFEERAVAYLRRHKGTKKAVRGSVTLAEFLKSLADEVKADGGVPFFSPALNISQPIRKAKERKSEKDRRERAERGIGLDAKLTVQGKDATPGQVRLMERVLDVAKSLDAGPKVTLALVMACIQESKFHNLSGGDRDSSGILQVRASIARAIAAQIGKPFDPRDVEQVVAYFIEHGYWKYGSAKKIARDQPGIEAADLAQLVQGSGVPRGYAPWHDEAEKIIDAYNGGGGRESRDGYYKRFEYARGKHENSWDCMGRWADKVHWRRFMRQGVLWYISEESLFAQRPSIHLVEGQDGVDWLDFSIDFDDVALVAELTAYVRANTWTVLPGMVATVGESGPADGRWLVTRVKVSLLDAARACQVTLAKPIPERAEPAPEYASRETKDKDGADRSHVDRVYEAAQHISDQNRPYTWGGGHARPLDQTTPTEGLDCSGSVSLVLKRGGLFDGANALVAEGFKSWGQPGQGKYMTVWANAEHVWIEFNLPHESGKRFDTSPHGDGPSGPHVRKTDRGHEGFTARHWPGT